MPGRPGNAAKPFAFRVDQPLSRIADAGSTIPPGPGVESPVLDLQFGRLTAFPDSLDPVQWSSIMSRARESGGHAVLEKAPGWFRAQAQPWLCEDTPRTALEKRLEAGLDPAGVFAHPGNPFAASSPKAGMPGRSDSQAAEVSP
jgi:hypothetical protein